MTHELKSTIQATPNSEMFLRFANDIHHQSFDVLQLFADTVRHYCDRGTGCTCDKPKQQLHYQRLAMAEATLLHSTDHLTRSKHRKRKGYVQCYLELDHEIPDDGQLVMYDRPPKRRRVRCNPI